MGLLDAIYSPAVRPSAARATLATALVLLHAVVFLVAVLVVGFGRRTGDDLESHFPYLAAFAIAVLAAFPGLAILHADVKRNPSLEDSQRRRWLALLMAVPRSAAVYWALHVARR